MLFKNFDQLIANGQTPVLRKKRRDVLDILKAALESVNPYLAVERVFKDGQIVFEAETIDTASFDNIYLVGFGKASIGMAHAVCDSIEITKGAVVTNDSSAILPSDKIEVVVGGHPIPNNRSVLGAEKILDVVKQCSENDLLIVLISGGGSALLCKPRVSLDGMQETTNLLLRSGANIKEINTIRKHLSHVKGGQLVKQAKGTVISMVISDIVGDPLEFISSGPTNPDSTTFSDAKKVLEKYDLWKEVPDGVRKVIYEGINGKIPETPKKDDPVFDQVFNFVVANNEIACEAALEKAKSLGYEGKLLTTSLTGEARDIGRYLVDKAKSSLIDEQTVFITGGETTVTIKGSGKGGRNLELVLGSIEDINDIDMVIASFASDGVDGNCDAAGAIADRFTPTRANEKGLISTKFLEENNSYEFFSELNDVIITGPTGTNVMDIQLILV
jgi:glycerate-2-kinase